MIIYPPLVGELVPAFLYHDTTLEGAAATTISIPFEWNPAVPKSSKITLKLQIKDYFTSTIIYTSTTGVNGLSGTAVFVVPDTPYTVKNVTYTFPVVGQYYKLQIAYDDGDTSVLTYSSASLGKCISSGVDMYISDVQEFDTGDTMIENCVDYKGVYLRDQLNEPLYSYRFDFKDQFGKVLESSGDVIWDNEQDGISIQTYPNQLLWEEPELQVDNSPYGALAYMITEYNEQNQIVYSSQLLLYLSETIEVHLGSSDTVKITIQSFDLADTITITDKTLIKLWHTSGIYIQNQGTLIEGSIITGTFKIQNYQVLINGLSFKSSPTYHLNYEPQIGQTYSMDFTITTINGYSRTVSRQVQKQLSEAPLYDFDLVANTNGDDGYVDLSLGLENLYCELTNETMYSYTTPYTTSDIGLNAFNSSERAEIAHFAGLKSGVYNYNIEFPIDTSSIEVYDDNNNTLEIITLPYLMPKGTKCNLSFKLNMTQQDTDYLWTYSSRTLQILNLKGMNGQFSIERSTIENQNSNWETITTFAVGASTDLSTWSWRDFSAELGTDYIYRIRQFNKGQYSTPISFAYATLPAEHMFLSDGEKQLKIAFNPKVSSFKTTTLETKTDTIGGKYPIFYRNGQVGYKEIPISGLISYQMDDNQFFMTDDELGLNSKTTIRESTAAADSSIKGRTTNLVDYNILAERKFKLAVLDWLNNGKPKLFRSGPEGNYIVRLMNVSLSPNDTVGRMLHTFSCTGYEIAECTFDKLKELNLINIDTLVPDGVDYTTEQYLGSGEGLTKYYIRNLSWSTLTPVLYSKIQLKPVGSENYLYFINATGLFETPKDVVYEELIIPANNISDKNAKDYNELANSTFNYEIDSGTYDSATDTFGTTKTTVVWEKAAVKSYSNVYYLSAVIETPDKNSYIKLNDDDKPIDLSDGQTRYYYDLGNVTISAIVNASVIIAYGKQEATS